jgi:hypothetical protein
MINVILKENYIGKIHRFNSMSFVIGTIDKHDWDNVIEQWPFHQSIA